MRHTRRSVEILAAILLFASNSHAQQAKRAITVNDLLAMHRVSDPQISPDGKWVAYSIATPDIDANHLVRNIWVVAVSGGQPRQLTHGGSDQRPRWSPDSHTIAYLGMSGDTPQVFMIPAEGGDPHALTSISTGADNELWSPDGNWVAFISSVYPDCKDDACNSARDAENNASKVKARVYDHLLYRHWLTWSDGKRSHLFVVPAGGGTPKDLTPGANYDVPPFNLGAPEAIAFSPDNKELCFTANKDKVEATSTNGDLFTVPVSGLSAPKAVTTNPADDWGPAYSPDGKFIAYRAQTIPGYESDRWRLMLYNRATGAHVDVTEGFDRNVESYEWAPDSRGIYLQAENEAEMPIYRVDAAANSTPMPVVKDGFNEEFALSNDGQTLVFTRSSLTYPSEIFTSHSDGTGVTQLTHHNAELLSQLDLPPAEPFWFEGANNTKVEGLLIRPPHFDANKKYPMLFLVHGGPQGAWDDDWGYRWNQQVMAAPGYVAVMVNPRGSTGYGQKFTAEISRDWGGKVYTDLMNGVDAAIAKYPFIDGSRVAAAGGSYGGYMMDWMATHTDRFKCLISHAGPYDLLSMYGSTEELWFPEWELAGVPWKNPELYEKWSPSTYAANLGKFKTPTLVIGGELDYRVPYTQDLEFFSALQRQDVPSKLMIFPDEGHWVLKPQNSQLWYKTFLGWLSTYLR